MTSVPEPTRSYATPYLLLAVMSWSVWAAKMAALTKARTYSGRQRWGTGGGPQDCPATWTFASMPESWRWPDLEQYLDVDAVPWQEEAVRAAVKEHGAARFAGLDLLGLA